MRFLISRYRSKDEGYKRELQRKYYALPWAKKRFVQKMVHPTVQRKYIMYEHTRGRLEQLYPALKKQIKQLMRLTTQEFDQEYGKLKHLIRNPQTPGRTWSDLIKSWMLRDEKRQRDQDRNK